jgi:hypothetical protein
MMRTTSRLGVAATERENGERAAGGGPPARVRRMDHPSPAAARRDQTNP